MAHGLLLVRGRHAVGGGAACEQPLVGEVQRTTMHWQRSKRIKGMYGRGLLSVVQVLLLEASLCCHELLRLEQLVARSHSPFKAGPLLFKA